MEITKVANEIENKINQIEQDSKHLKSRAEAKAETIGIYEKVLAKCLIGLKNGKQYTLEGEIIQNPPATITEKIAKGLCWQEKIEMDKAETLYKNTIEWLRCLQAELNGWQSIYRHLSDK